MEELQDYFGQSGTKKPIKLRTSQTKGRLVITDDLMYAYSNKPLSDTDSCSSWGTEYAREYREKEKKSYQEYLQLKELEESKDGMECLEELTSIGDTAQIADLTEEALTRIYSNYSFKRDLDCNLAINETKDRILGSISSQPVTIVEGPTGCGKTTQVPQWILDECYERKKHCNIVVTQPRRIAAISIAKRVAQERGWDLGGLVGYQVGLENKTNMDTRISYVTTGVLLQKLVAAQTLNAFTHIVLDEIHERGKDMDFLLLVVKKLLFTNSRGVKVILMSATFNIHQFSQYFEIPTSSGKYEKASVICVKKKNRYMVKEFYLNHLVKLGALPMIKYEEPGITKEGYDTVIKLLNAFEHIDANEASVDNVEVDVKPSVLIFLPGILEIEALYNNLTDLQYRGEVEKASVSHKWWVVPLHSTITGDEQGKVFQKAPPAHRKIILSTNIAESSITVPDIKYVVDFCLMKVLVADPQTNFTSLQLAWASKTNCKQRSGRAGRARDGRVYRLVPDHFYDMLPEECVPEMKRSPLEQLVLLAKMLNMGPPKQILALSMDPPDLYNIQRTILVLKETGGLLKTLGGEVSNEDGDITYLGRIMAKLPVDVRISKLIVLGYLFGCLEDCIVMGAAMSAKNVFSTPFQERLNAYNSKLTWANGTTSDCLAFCKVYKVWQSWKRGQVTKASRGQDKTFARDMYLQLKALNETGELVVELTHRLAREGIEHAPGQNKAAWSREELPLILKILVAGAFYPHYFIQRNKGDDYQREAVKVLGGLDPCNTVYLTSPALMKQPGRLYARSLENALEKYIIEPMSVTFDKTGCKAYVTFGSLPNVVHKNMGGSPAIPGKVGPAVYKAVKINQLRIPISINILPEDKANEAARLLPGELSQEMLEQCLPRLPDIEDTFIDIHISHYINCGHFWAQYVDSSLEQLKQMEAHMNSVPLLAITRDPEVGDILAAPFQEAANTPLMYCRARVEKLEGRMVSVQYIDYGNSGKVAASCLKELLPWMRSMRPLAMECILAQVVPSLHNNTRVVWSAEANALFQRLTSGKRLLGKVYAVAYGIVYLELMVNGQVSINKALVEKNLARPVDEGYQCQMNHGDRESAQDLQISQIRALNLQQLKEAHKLQVKPPPPDPRDCSQLMYFKGPFSPLESTVNSMMHVSRDKPVTIEWNSVNSVLLDTDPQDCFDRLMVAAAVTQNSDRLSIRHTTLLPNIPGLPAFISMMFCPSMELRRDPTNSRYVSVLCGLGHYNGRAIYPEHDMLVDIDVEMDIKDLESINYLRYLMNTMLTLQDGQDQPNVTDKFKEQVPSKIRENILQLTTASRGRLDPVSVRNPWSWGNLPPGDVQLPDTCFDQERAIFPLHDALQLYPMPANHTTKLLKENEKMHKLVKGINCPTNKTRDMNCPICESVCLPLPAMRIHLTSQRHRHMEAYLNRQLEPKSDKE